MCYIYKKGHPPPIFPPVPPPKKTNTHKITTHTGIDGLDDSGPPDYPEVDDDPATRRGFDRLRTHGFTIAEVAALRSYFTPQVCVWGYVCVLWVYVYIYGVCVCVWLFIYLVF